MFADRYVMYFYSTFKASFVEVKCFSDSAAVDDLEIHSREGKTSWDNENEREIIEANRIENKGLAYQTANVCRSLWISSRAITSYPHILYYIYIYIYTPKHVGECQRSCIICYYSVAEKSVSSSTKLVLSQAVM